MQVCTMKYHNSAKKKKSLKKYCVVPFQNGGPITDFYFNVISILDKILKTTFPKDFSMNFGS